MLNTVKELTYRIHIFMVSMILLYIFSQIKKYAYVAFHLISKLFNSSFYAAFRLYFYWISVFYKTVFVLCSLYGHRVISCRVIKYKAISNTWEQKNSVCTIKA